MDSNERKDAKVLKRLLRKCFRLTKVSREVYTKARIVPGLYLCALCKKSYGRQQLEIDHIVPVSVAADKDDNLSDYMAGWVRALLDPTNLQLLCKSCHRQK